MRWDFVSHAMKLVASQMFHLPDRLQAWQIKFRLPAAAKQRRDVFLCGFDVVA